MGFFSWKTADTDESIANVHTGNHKTVFLLQPDGAEPIEERAYDGYGRFGGVDAYEWLAQHNGGEDRGDGIEMSWEDDNDTPRYPSVPLKFSFSKDAVYEDLPPSENCPRQGYFFG